MQRNTSDCRISPSGLATSVSERAFQLSGIHRQPYYPKQNNPNFPSRKLHAVSTNGQAAGEDA